ncbi:MAG: hypothetical protein HXX20_24180 [Chloroflexi bacterium]|nr:hypothetical protein [Chloroflexota bacterium]
MELSDQTNELFEVETEISPENLKKLEAAIRTLSTTKDLKSWLGGKGRIQIGDPVVLPAVPLLKKSGEEIPADIQLQLKQYDFYLVQFACSFQAGDNSRFHQANFEIKLITEPQDPASPVAGAAMAYDLYPEKVEDEIKVSKNFTLGPDFKIKAKLGPVEAEASVVPLKIENKQEYVVYNPKLEAFGRQASDISWQFSRTKSHEIGGAQALSVLVRKPKGSKVKAKLSLTASLELVINLVALPPIPLTTKWRKKGSAVEDPTIDLC